MPRAGCRSQRTNGAAAFRFREVEVANKYIYNGYVADQRGPVVQPYLEVFGEFYRGTGVIDSAALKLTLFESFQPRGDSDSDKFEPLRSWYEFEVEAGLELRIAKQLTVAMMYRRFESPNGAFGSTNSFDLEFALDDSRWLGACALHPRVEWIAPLRTGSDDEEGHYFEAGIAPEFALNKSAEHAMRLRFPVNVGFGDTHQYLGRHFGFFSAGAALKVPLTFLPAGFGAWDIGASATYYRLGAVPAELSNRGDRDVFVFAASLGTSF